MTPAMVRSGTSAYGQRKWNETVRDIALGQASRKRLAEAEQIAGRRLPPLYSTRGIALDGVGFGMEIFHAGAFSPLPVVEAENRTLCPSQVMNQFDSGEMLGVFWSHQKGSLFCRWDDVAELRGEDIVLTYDNLAPLLGRKRSFALVRDVRWRGEGAKRKEFTAIGELRAHKQVFHKVN